MFAGWLRYLPAVDDEGKPFERSSDPRLSELTEKLKDFKFGKNDNAEEIIAPILKDDTIFGTDLSKIGLDKK